MPSYDNIVILGAIQRLAQELKVIRARVETVYEAVQRVEERGVRLNLDDMDDSDSDDGSASEESANSAPF